MCAGVFFFFFVFLGRSCCLAGRPVKCGLSAGTDRKCLLRFFLTPLSLRVVGFWVVLLICFICSGSIRAYLCVFCVVVRVFGVARQSLGAGEKDDRDVIAAIEASKRENSANGHVGEQREEQDPEILKAMAESR